MRGYDFQKMIKQAQKMQGAVMEVQQELESVEVAGTASNGLVNVVVNGKGGFKKITIKPEAINPDNPDSVDQDNLEMLEDLISAAFNDAHQKADELSKTKMESITGGMNIPGLL